jgi:MoaA/NifB/PqqE/SkfB family radical SAM enzyme
MSVELQQLRKKNAESINFKLPVVSTYPLSCEVITGTRCNSNCIMCYWRVLHLPVVDIDIGMVKRFMDMVPPYFTNITFSGYGDPLAHPQIRDLLKIVADKQVPINLTTNGANLHLVNDLLQKWGQFITVSIDTTNPSQYESIRKGLKFNQVMANLKDLAQRANANHEKGITFPRITINYCVLPNTIEYMRSMVELAEQLNLYCVRFLYGNLPPGSPIERMFKPMDKDDSRVVANIAWGRARKKVEIVDQCTSAGIPLAGCTKGSLCTYPWQTLVLTHEGRLFPCCKYLVPCPSGERDEWRDFGNMHTATDFMRDIWNSTNAIRLRKLILENPKTFPTAYGQECDSCLKYSGKR